MPTEYVDQNGESYYLDDDGQEVSEFVDQNGETYFAPATSSQPEEDQSAWEDFKHTLGQAWWQGQGGVANMVAGGATALGDATGYQPLTDWGLEKKTNIEENLKNELAQYPLPEDSNWQKAANVGGGLYSSIPAMASIPMGGFIAPFAIQGGATTYGDLRHEGVSPEDAVLPSAGVGAASGVMAYPMKFMGSAPARSILATMATTAPASLISNVITKKTLGEDITPEDVERSLIEEPLTMGAVAALTHGAGKLAGKLGSKKVVTPEELQIDNAINSIGKEQPILLLPEKPSDVATYDYVPENGGRILALPETTNQVYGGYVDPNTIPLTEIAGQTPLSRFGKLGEGKDFASLQFGKEVELKPFEGKQYNAPEVPEFAIQKPSAIETTPRETVNYAPTPSDVIVDRAKQQGIIPSEQPQITALYDRFGNQISDLNQYPTRGEVIGENYQERSINPVNTVNNLAPERFTPEEVQAYQADRDPVGLSRMSSKRLDDSIPSNPQMANDVQGSHSDWLLNKAIKESQITQANLKAKPAEPTATKTTPDSPIQAKAVEDVNVKPVKAVQQSLFPERGSLSFKEGTDNPILKATDDIKARISDYWNDPDISKLPEIEQFFKGTTLGHEIPGLSNVRASYHKSITFPKTIAEKSPEFAPMFRDGLNLFRQRTYITADTFTTAKGYFELSDQSRNKIAMVRDKAYTAGKTRDQITPDVLKAAGLSDAEIKGYQDLDAALQKSLGYIAETKKMAIESKYLQDYKHYQDLILKSNITPEAKTKQITALSENINKNKAIALNNLNSEIAALSTKTYMPHSRWGDRYITTMKNGQPDTVEYFEKLADYNKALREYKAKGVEVEHGFISQTAAELKDPLKGNTNTPLDGFWGHLQRSKQIGGYSQNWDKVLADYFNGLGNYVSKEQAKVKFRSHLDRLNEANARNERVSPKLYEYAQKYAKDMVTDGSQFSSNVNKALTHFYLGYNFKSALLNSTSMLTTSAPLASKYLAQAKTGGKSSIALLAKSVKKASNTIESLRNSKNLEDRALGEGLHRALKEGEIADTLLGQVQRLAKGKQNSGLSKALDPMAMFSFTEMYNRKVSFVMGWDVGKKLGMSGENLFNFAEKFVEDTQFIYSKANRPEIARSGYGASAFLFRLYPGNYIRFVRNLAKDGGYLSKPVIQTLGTMVALGGVQAFPMAKIFLNAAEASGYDPKKKIREVLPENLADNLIYGLPINTGVSIGGALSFESPEFDKDIYTIGGKLVGGVPFAFADRMIKGGKYVLQGNVKGAVEQFLPEGGRQVASAYRAANEGAFRTLNDNPKELNPTNKELALKALGLMPGRLAKANERDTRSINEATHYQDMRKRFNHDLGEAAWQKTKTGDASQLQAVMQQIREYNAKAKPHQRYIPKTETIQDYILKQKNPRLYEFKKTRKAARGEYLRNLQLMGEYAAEADE